MATFSIEIVTPTHVITEENVSYLRCPGMDGSFGVMAGHTDGIIALSVGEVKVEILDGRHAPMEGFSFDDADTLSTTAVDHVVTWRGGDADVSALVGRPVRLKIHFKNAKLYAFQFR